MTGNALILPAIAAILVFLIYMLAMHMTSKADSTSDRVRRLTDQPVQQQEEEKESQVIDPLRQDMEESQLAVVLENLMNVIGINTEKFRKSMQLKFYQAGITSPNAPV